MKNSPNFFLREKGRGGSPFFSASWKQGVGCYLWIEETAFRPAKKASIGVEIVCFLDTISGFFAYRIEGLFTRLACTIHHGASLFSGM